ncbi:histidine kinase [Streptomyces sp. DSM 44915]|uniref:histidine kinase n=1 Tax=Streptomyces chisholmiae TaxID=3075540 RepID=A0ABU2JZN2_9ACTN|nr:histidine kinase [Streptomyces sp. DSM 44915]MDT0270445.1 histidine kinase [Streptomyces sp. DSM 44915]
MPQPHLPWPRLRNALVGPAAVVPALIDQATTDTDPLAYGALSLYSVLVLVALAQRARWPLGGFAAVLVVLAVAEVWCAAREVQLTGLAVLPVAFAIYAVGARCSVPQALTALVAGTLIVSVGVTVNHATAGSDWRGGSDVLAALAPIPVVWGLGVLAQSHRQRLLSMERHAADAERERHLLAERAAAAERVRIARDMHDVVAHSLTLLVVHAETMRARSGDLPEWAREQVDALAAAGRQATVEMRELLGLLRNGAPEEAPRAPAPTLAELPPLVAAARQAGNPVRLTTDGELARVARPVQLTGYRLVQETLANARRHAPGAAVTVDLRVADGALRVAVGCAAPRRPVAPVPGPGTGLEGLRERVAAGGGTFAAGGTPDGGFRVVAELPLGDRPPPPRAGADPRPGG